MELGKEVKRGEKKKKVKKKSSGRSGRPGEMGLQCDQKHPCKFENLAYRPFFCQ